MSVDTPTYAVIVVQVERLPWRRESIALETETHTHTHAHTLTHTPTDLIFFDPLVIVAAKIYRKR